MSEITPEMYVKLRKQSPPRWSTPEMEAVRKEKTSRFAIAQGRARTALTKLYPAEYRALYLLALDEVYAERGPILNETDND